MDKKIEQKLYKTYPKLFAQHNLPISQTAMSWGCQHGDGWAGILFAVCERLTQLIKAKEIPEFEFTTIKEKFGTLRMYYTPNHSIADLIIDFGERLSQYVCEECGTMSTVSNVELRRMAHIQTLCDDCYNRMKLEWSLKSKEVFKKEKK